MTEDNKHKESLHALTALAVFAFIFLIGFNKVWETDAWWHLRTGQLITETRTLPRTDVFSYTSEGKRWVHDEWLGETYLYGMFSRYGFGGLIAFTAAAGACALYLAFGAAKARGASIPLAACIVAVAAISARTRISPRPDVFALLFFSIDIYILNRLFTAADDDARARKMTSYIPLLQVFWVNAHPSGLIGVCLPLLAMICGAAAFILSGKTTAARITFDPGLTSKKMKLLGTVFIFTALTSLLNPYHIHALTAAFEFKSISIYSKHIAEWAAIPYRDLLLLKGDTQADFFAALLLISIVSFAFNRRRINLFDAALLIGTAYMAVSSRRFIAMFAIAAAPIAAVNLSPFLGKLAGRLKMPDENSRVSTAVAAALLFMFALGWHQTHRDPHFIFGTGFNKKTVPLHAADFIIRNKISGNMYNDYGSGGYLIWKLYPKSKVFIDGRTTLHGPRLYSEMIEFEKAPTPEKWSRLEDKYHPEFAVLSIEQRSVRDAILYSGRGWRLIFWDSRAMILVKDIPKYKDVISKKGYSLTEPYTVMNLPHQWRMMDNATHEQALNELERNLRESDDSALAARALAIIYYREHKPADALRVALAGIRADPGVASLHALAGQIELKQGRMDKALGHFGKAASLDGKYKKILRQIKR